MIEIHEAKNEKDIINIFNDICDNLNQSKNDIMVAKTISEKIKEISDNTSNKDLAVLSNDINKICSEYKNRDGSISTELNNLINKHNKDFKKVNINVLPKRYYYKNIIKNCFKIVDVSIKNEKVFLKCFNEIYCVLINLEDLIKLFNINGYFCKQKIRYKYNFNVIKTSLKYKNKKLIRYYYAYIVMKDIFVDLIRNNDMCEQFLKRIEVFSNNFEKHSLYVSEKYLEITEKNLFK